MLMKQDLCVAINNPPGFAVIGQIGRSNAALKVALQPPNEEVGTTPRGRQTERKKGISWARHHTDQPHNYQDFRCQTCPVGRP